MLARQFPTHRNREFFAPLQGIKSGDQGIYSPDQGIARRTCCTCVQTGPGVLGQSRAMAARILADLTEAGYRILRRMGWRSPRSAIKRLTSWAHRDAATGYLGGWPGLEIRDLRAWRGRTRQHAPGDPGERCRGALDDLCSAHAHLRRPMKIHRRALLDEPQPER